MNNGDNDRDGRGEASQPSDEAHQGHHKLDEDTLSSEPISGQGHVETSLNPLSTSIKREDHVGDVSSPPLNQLAGGGEETLP